MINSTERSDILVFNCYLCHVSFLLTCYVCSTKIGEISEISKCFENFVSQTLGVLTRIYAAQLRDKLLNYWLDNPKEGFKRGVELLANKDKIKAMAVAKAIREGVDPDKAMPILDKIIKNIPTIEIDL